MWAHRPRHTGERSTQEVSFEFASALDLPSEVLIFLFMARRTPGKPAVASLSAKLSQATQTHAVAREADESLMLHASGVSNTNRPQYPQCTSHACGSSIAQATKHPFKRSVVRNAGGPCSHHLYCRTEWLDLGLLSGKHESQARRHLQNDHEHPFTARGPTLKFIGDRHIRRPIVAAHRFATCTKTAQWYKMNLGAIARGSLVVILISEVIF